MIIHGIEHHDGRYKIMIDIRIESDKRIQESTKNKLISIFQNSEDLRTSLAGEFPNGFTSFDKARFILVLGNGTRFVEYIQIEGFKSKAIEYEDDDYIITRYDRPIDY